MAIGHLSNVDVWSDVRMMCERLAWICADVPGNPNVEIEAPSPDRRWPLV